MKVKLATPITMPNVDIQISYREAELLKKFLGSIGGHKHNPGGLRVEGIMGNDAAEMRDQLVDPLWTAIKDVVKC